MNKCPRVQARIECPECGYPFSEAYYALSETQREANSDWAHPDGDPGHIGEDESDETANSLP